MNGPLLAACLAAVSVPAEAASTHLTYNVYARGFRAMVLEATLDFDRDQYRVTMSDHTVGLIGALFTNRVASSASGTLAGGVPHPTHYESAGYSRGADRHTVIDYAGADPRVDVLTPVEANRDKVPPSETIGAVDTLSAIAGLVRQVAETGHCSASLRIFDGARLTDLAVHDEGNAPLPPDDRSPFSGTALRCDFTTTLRAGFIHNADYARNHLPQHGTVWVAPAAAGGQPVPIRATFTTVDHGTIAVFLQRADAQGAS